jgi:hypothetical protein
MTSKLVAKSADEQAGYSATDDERRKEKIAMWWHATRRSFDEGAFCEGDEKWWTAYVNEGLVFAVAKAAKLWSGGQFRFAHIVETQMFQEAQPYHPKQLNLGQRFEIYMQAFRVINMKNFLQEAELL